jgi:hypothetical protein
MANVESSNIVEIQHMELVRYFIDKERAKGANSDLLRIVAVDSDKFIEVVGYTKWVASSLRVEEDQGAAEHRQTDRRKKAR